MAIDVHAGLERIADRDQEQARQAGALGEGAPVRRELGCRGQVVRGEDHEDRSALDAHVARIVERPQAPGEMVLLVLAAGIRLLDQRLVRQAVPDAGPGLVRPGKAEREVGLARGEDLVEGPLEDAPTGAEPVVPVAEAFDAGLPRHPGLRDPRLRDAQVVEAEVGGDVRLPVPAEQGSRLRDVRPFREAWSPPAIVLRDREELRQVEGDQAGNGGRHALVVSVQARDNHNPRHRTAPAR
jgi:hypothetical protein